MRNILVSIVGFTVAVYAQEILTIVANGSPYPVTDKDGNSRGFNPLRSVLYDVNQTAVSPTTIVLEEISSAGYFTVSLIGLPGAGNITATINDKNIFAPVRVTGTGDKDVGVELAKARLVTAAPWAITGTITWKFNGAPFAETPVEVYAVSNTLPPYFAKYGIYRDLLQWILPQNDGTEKNPKTTEAFNAYAVKQVHFNSNHKYDTYSGASRYAWYGDVISRRNKLNGTFSLRNWLDDLESASPVAVNCYDQASLVQIMCSLGPTPMGLLSVGFLRPFGYLSPTSLVGFPGIKVNNPFFHNNITLARVAEKNENRTSFDNHMFAVIGDPSVKADLSVCDATAGPAKCDLKLKDYIDAAIDDKNAVNLGRPKPNKLRVGPGIIDFDTAATLNSAGTANSRIKRQDSDDYASELRTRLAAISALNKDNDSSMKNVYRPDFKRLGRGLGGKIGRSSVVVGGDSAVFQYLYDIDDTAKDIHIRITVADDYETAFLALVHVVAQTSTKLEDIYEGPSTENRLGAWTINSKLSGAQGSVIFVDGNVLVEITGLADTKDLQYTAKKIQNFISKPPADAKPEVPSIGELQSRISVRVGETHTLKVNVANCLTADWKLKEGHALVTYMNHGLGDRLEVDVVGVTEGEEEIQLIVLNGAGKKVIKYLAVDVTA